MRLGSEVYEQICLAAASADGRQGNCYLLCAARAFGEADAKNV